MGWTFQPDSTRRSIIASLTKGWANDKSSVTCLRHSYKGSPWGGVLYGLMESRREGGEVERWIMVTAMAYWNLKGGERGWAWREDSEACGPLYYSCPLSYVKQATPTKETYAIEWRQKVIKYWEGAAIRRAARKAERTIGPGVGNLVGGFA